MSDQEKAPDFNQAREHYLSLPFDSADMLKKRKRYLYTIKAFTPLVIALSRPTVINKELIPKGDGLIFTSNHLGSFDQFPMIAGAIGCRPLRAIMSSTLFTAKEFFRGYLFDFLGSAVSVDISSPDAREKAQTAMIQLILHGSNVLYFPEGTRGTKSANHNNPLPLKFQKGAIMNALITGATIVPFSINNDYKLFRKNHIVVRVNKPMTVSPADNIDEAVAELRNRTISGIKQNQEYGFKIKRKGENNKWVDYYV